METTEVQVHLKKLHPAQKFILDNRRRFNVIKCGRRFGKTEIAQELISETGLDLIPKKVAYFSPTYKDLFEVWIACKSIFHDVIAGKDENVKQLRFITGGKADFWSMEDPDSGRGRSYHRVIIDECEKAGKFREAWQQTIRATLTDYSGDGYFLSTPQLGETYFKEMAQLEKSYDDWRTFKYTTYDNPHINRAEIEQARILLPEEIFASEYLAEDIVGLSLNPFFHQYKIDRHEATQEEINKGVAVFDPSKQIVMHIDFNIDPFALGFSHIWQDNNGMHDHQFNELSIPHGSIPEMIDRVLSLYGRWIQSAILTGDAMGNRGEIGQRDNASNYMQLLRGLNMSNSQLKVPANPLQGNSRADCNYVLLHHRDFKINPKSCPITCKQMKSTQWDSLKGKIIKQNRNDPNQLCDMCDSVRYKMNFFYKKSGWIDRHSKGIR